MDAETKPEAMITSLGFRDGRKHCSPGALPWRPASMVATSMTPVPETQHFLGRGSTVFCHTETKRQKS